MSRLLNSEGQPYETREEALAAVEDAGPLTESMRDAIRASMATYDVGLRWHTGTQSGREYVILKSGDMRPLPSRDMSAYEVGRSTLRMVLLQISTYLPLALWIKGGMLDDGRFEVLLWIDPPIDEFLKIHNG